MRVCVFMRFKLNKRLKIQYSVQCCEILIRFCSYSSMVIIIFLSISVNEFNLQDLFFFIFFQPIPITFLHINRSTSIPIEKHPIYLSIFHPIFNVGVLLCVCLGTQYETLMRIIHFIIRFSLKGRKKYKLCSCFSFSFFASINFIVVYVCCVFTKSNGL